MNRNRSWNQNARGRGRGGFNRGGRGGNRGWSWNHGGYNGPPNQGFGGGNRFQRDNPPKHWKNKEKWVKRDSPGKRLSEDLIGVTEYISTHEGFNGIIKSRYSDFQVSEMNEKGEIAKLTDTKPPVRPTDEAVDDDEDLLLNKYNLEILPMETWDKINSLAINTVSEDAENPKVEIDMEGVTKEQRTKIHDAVKKAFGDTIVGSTVNVGDKKFMRFEKYRKGVRVDNRVKWVWPGEYVYFVVHKENCDTMDAAARIAERIGVHLKPSILGYAGTKDRRAKTSQWFSAKRIDPARIATACRYLKDIHVGNFTFGDTNLKLGMLKGNKFSIALRNVTADEESVDTACQYLKEKGFINYYGLQRFGSRIDTPTFDIGLKLLQGKFKEAIDGILEPRAGPLEEVLRVNAARGAVAASALLPRRSVPSSHSEARLICALADAPHDLVGALSRLARNIRLLYLHSYQSLVWNRAVSERIRRFGLAPAPGDCVPLPNVEIKDSQHGESDSEDGEEEEDATPAASDSTSESDTKQSAKPKNKKKKTQNPQKPPLPIKILTQEDVDSGKYNVFNIVLPLPGAFVAYPPNMIDFYEEVLTKDGLKMDMKHKLKSYNMSGAYRHMVVRPLGVSWRHVRYSDPFADLLASDLDELQARPVTGLRQDGKYRALLLNMILPSSCYATMALRELLKVDTSSDNQALQNNYHKRNKADQKESNTESQAADQKESNTESQAAAQKESNTESQAAAQKESNTESQAAAQKESNTESQAVELTESTSQITDDFVAEADALLKDISEDVEIKVENENDENKKVEEKDTQKNGEKRKLEDDCEETAKKSKTEN